MTHYTVLYDGLSDIEKLSKAIIDIKEYIGEDKFNKLTEDARKDAETRPFKREHWHFTLSIAGVHGFPCDAWFIHAFGLQAYCDALKAEHDEQK